MTEKARKTGKELERHVADAYRTMGAWRVEHDVELAGHQIDVYVSLETPGGLLHRIAVEVKDWYSPVGVDVVNGFAAIVSDLRRERLIDEGIIVSASGFSKQARNAAKTYGIRLLESFDLDAMVEEAKAVGRTRPTVPPVPSLPVPYIAHPYPAQAHFTGREQERAELTAWLSGAPHPLLGVVAIGGMGKSALTWHWLQNDLLPSGLEYWGLQGALWWCFYERESGFERFLERAIAYVSGGELDATYWPVWDRMDCLRTLLAERRFLLMLDGAERLLRAYARMDAPYLGDEEAKVQRDVSQASPHKCADPKVGTFLQWLTGLGATKTLLTSRLLPHELEGLAGVARMDLTQMDPEDTVRFFRAMGIRGTRAEIQAACEPYGYLPLALRLLAGLVAEDSTRPGDIAAAVEYEITEDLRGKEQHHILEQAYDALELTARELLSRIAAFRSPVSYDVLEAIFTTSARPLRPRGLLERLFTRAWKHATFLDTNRLKAALQSLQQRGLLLRQEETGRYELYPMVRRYAYDRLADKEGTHARLRDHFAAVLPPERVESLDDLVPTIELYHHTVRAGRYDEAYVLLYRRLANSLYFRFGAYQVYIELLQALFPNGEEQPPQLKEESDQAWVLNALANSYSISGQPRHAVALFKQQIAILETQDVQESIAIGLESLAYMAELPLGHLAAAEQNLRRSIGLCCEIGNELLEAAGHRELGRLLVYQGDFNEAERELDAALVSFSKQGYRQPECVVWTYRALRGLLMGQTNTALQTSRRALELAEVERLEPDRIRAEWLLGAAYRVQGEVPQAEFHLTEALLHCRRINLVEVEPDILLELARLRHMQGRDEAHSLAHEALEIAERCEYRLKQADAYLFLAQLALEVGDQEAADEHAQTAYERAWCDGPPHCYKPTLQEAERLLLLGFLTLWTTVQVEDLDHRVRQFYDFFSDITALPLRRYRSLPDEGIYIGIFDLSAVFDELLLPFADQFPILFLATDSLNDEYLMCIRQSLSDHVGPSNRRALIIPFCNDQTLSDARNLFSGAMKQVHAYDIICLSGDDFQQIVTSKKPDIALRRVILSQADLVSIPAYNTSGPTPDDMFFGRERELQEICDHVASANYAFIGGRRIGKSSILKRLERVRLPAAGFHTLYHDCSFTPTQTELVQAVTADKLWFPDPPANPPASFAGIVQALPGERSLVILLDEADKLIEPDRQINYPLFHTLRALANAGRCRFVLSGERALRAELANPNSPLYNFADEMLIGRLDFRAVEELVTQPMRQLEIELADETEIVQRIWDFTSGHPNVVQRLCQRLIVLLNERQGRRLTLDEVEIVVADPDFLRKDFLNIYWERASALERLCSLVMAADDSVRTLTAAHEALASRDIVVTLNQVDDALERLVDLRNILQRTVEGYDFAVTAFPEVIAKTARLDDLIALNRETYQHHGDVEPRSKRGVS